MTHTATSIRACAEPGCKSPGRVQIVGSKSWFCFHHKPLGRIK